MDIPSVLVGLVAGIVLTNLVVLYYRWRALSDPSAMDVLEYRAGRIRMENPSGEGLQEEAERLRTEA